MYTLGKPGLERNIAHPKNESVLQIKFVSNKVIFVLSAHTCVCILCVRICNVKMIECLCSEGRSITHVYVC